MVLVDCMSFVDALYSMKFCENILNGYKVLKQTQFCDRQKDTDN